MTWRVTVVAFTGEPWPGQNVVDDLRINDKIRVTRPDAGKHFVVAEAAVEAETAYDAARDLYWRLREEGVVTRQSGGFLSVLVVDEQDQYHWPSMEAIIASGRTRKK